MSKSIAQELLEEGFELGMKEGEEKGEKKGLAKGLAKGQAKGQAKVLALWIEQKYHRGDALLAQRLQDMPEAELERITSRLLTAATYEELGI